MIENNQKLLLLSQIAVSMGEGTLIAVYNDIELKWYYYIGEFKASNPSSHIYHNLIMGKCINHIIDNSFTYFMGDNLAKNELIQTEFQKIPREIKEFDFKFIWFKG